MNREEIIRRLNHLADCAVNIHGETPYVLSLDDGIALKEATEIIASETKNREEILEAFIALKEMLELITSR